MIDTNGERLVSSTHDTTNTLFINDDEINTNLWVGDGNYTDTVEGHAITIKKAPDLTGNYQLIKVSDYSYEFARVKSEREQLIDLIYPVGSIYMSVNAVDPGTMFDGTEWEQIEDTFLLAAGSNYANGATGGEATHTLTTAQIPAHTHNSKSLIGTFEVRRYGTSGTGTDIIIGGREGYTGICSGANGTWSGTHALINAGGRSISGPLTDVVTINATHTHDSVGSGNAHNNMPPYLAVNIWQRIS